MWKHSKEFFVGWFGMVAGYLSVNAAVALSVMLAGALVGDLAFGQVWVVGALGGGWLIVAADLRLLFKLNETMSESPAVEPRDHPELAPFSFTVGGPGLKNRRAARGATAGSLVRKEGFNYAA